MPVIAEIPFGGWEGMAKVEGWHHKDVHHLCCEPLQSEGVRNSAWSGSFIILGLLFLLLPLSFKALSIVLLVLNRTR